MDGAGEWLMERQSNGRTRIEGAIFPRLHLFPSGKKEREIEEAIDGAGGATAADAHT